MCSVITKHLFKRLYLMIRVFFEGKSIDYIGHLIAEHNSQPLILPFQTHIPIYFFPSPAFMPNFKGFTSFLIRGGAHTISKPSKKSKPSIHLEYKKDLVYTM